VLKDLVSRLENFDRKLSSIRLEHRAAYEKKEETELRARIREWAANLDEIKEEAIVHTISTEVRNRVIIQLLYDDLQRFDGIDQRVLENADLFFKNCTQTGKFLWENTLHDAFPESDFWFLYTEPGRR